MTSEKFNLQFSPNIKEQHITFYNRNIKRGKLINLLTKAKGIEDSFMLQ